MKDLQDMMLGVIRYPQVELVLYDVEYTRLSYMNNYTIFDITIYLANQCMKDYKEINVVSSSSWRYLDTDFKMCVTVGFVQNNKGKALQCSGNVSCLSMPRKANDQFTYP